jgi:hypothetical protein
MNSKFYSIIRVILTAVVLVGMLIAFLLNQVIIGLVVFGLGFAILQIVKVKYRKDPEK